MSGRPVHLAFELPPSATPLHGQDDASDRAAPADLLQAGAQAWALAIDVADSFVQAPHILGGIWLRARAGPVRDAFLAHIRQRLGSHVSMRRIPPTIDDERLLGGLDLTATLQSGQPVYEKGLLAELDGGVAVLAMAERLSPAVAAKLAQVCDAGRVVHAAGYAAHTDAAADTEHAAHVSQLASSSPASLGFIALDETDTEDAQRANPAIDRLRDHFAFGVSLEMVPWSIVEAWRQTDTTTNAHTDQNSQPSTSQVAAAVKSVTVADDLIEQIAHTAEAFGIASLRALQHATRVMRLLAMIDGRATANADDAQLAAQWVLAHRATRLPTMTEPPSEEPEAQHEPTTQDTPSTDDLPDQSSPDQPNQDTIVPEDILLEATRAALPADVLARLLTQQNMRQASATAGPSGALQASKVRGRPSSTRPGKPGRNGRLSLIATLRAAAPWQPLRAKQTTQTHQAPRVLVRTNDFRITRFKQRAQSLTIFAVDASGSAAAQRLA
ncbi:MAG: hypothetical protein AAGF32_07290, partial [Pseudomonadota bacterium]